MSQITNFSFYDPFKKSHVHRPPNEDGAAASKKYLALKPQKGTVVVEYELVDKPPEFISEYAHKRLSEINNLLNKSILTDLGKTRLLETAKLIYADAKEEYKHLSWWKKALHRVCIAVGLHKSSKAIESAYQDLQKAHTPAVNMTSHLQGNPADLEVRRQLHRSPNKSLPKYEGVALTNQFMDPAVKDSLEIEEDRLPGMPIDEKAILVARLKEKAADYAYAQIDDNVSAGYYDPAIIPLDIEKLLGKLETISEPITSHSQLNKLLKEEIKKYLKAGKLNKHQAEYLTHDALKIAKRYLSVFPDKSYRDAFFLTRDLIRLAAYQEYHDKASFSGSDHGSKHIHHNILGALAMHKQMDKAVDYTNKDKFLEQLVHFYHDIGYSVGLAGSNFACCKDHPFIGAKMITSMKDYFLHYLDEISFTTLHDCVLYHAIINPDLTAREEINGVHPGMVRSVTSTADACAVTYDRKTQEFWEQPKALLALASLKTFLVLYPEYQKPLDRTIGEIEKDKWPGYSEDNPLDQMAYDIYTHVVDELNLMVEKYDIPDERKDLFRQAINEQFTSFKANVTLGQYGARMVGIGVVPNEDKKDRDAAPKYLTEVSLAPSMLYGLLKDLFGEDQALTAFKKLVEEFGGKIDEIKGSIDEIGKAMDEGKKVKPRSVRTGVAIFKFLSVFDHDKKDSHMVVMARNIREVLQKIQSVYKAQKVSVAKRTEVIQAFDAWAIQDETGRVSLAAFFQEHVLPLAGTGADGLIRFVGKKNEFTPAEIASIRNTLKLVLVSDEEYEFMRGNKTGVPRRSDVYSRLIPLE